MEHRSPTTDALHELVHTARYFQREKPWEHLRFDQPFGIRDPQTGRVVLAVINGCSGIDFGLSTFPGLDGLITLNWLRHALIADTNEASLHGIRSIICALVPRSNLTPGDRRLLVDARCDATRGESVPLFRSYMPGYLPWRLDAEEVRMLTLMLHQSVNVARDCAMNPRLFEGGPKHTYLTRWNMRDGDEAPEAYEWASPDLGGPPPRIPMPDELTSARLGRLPLDEHAEWEIALASGAGALQPTPHHRPELMLTCFVIDRASGFIHHGHPLPSSTALDGLQAQIVGVLLRLGFAPRRMLVRDPVVRPYLAPVAKLVGCRLQRVQSLPAVDEASADMKEFMTRRG